MRAMILAAGRGQRMRPLTDTTPKPLLKVGGKALIEWHLERLARAGITDIVINHAWLGSCLTQALGNGKHHGVHIRYSAESPALETAGGIAHALHMLGEAPFLVINGDVWCNWNPHQAQEISQTLRAEEKQAWLLLAPNPAHHRQGDFCLDSSENVSSLAPNTRHDSPQRPNSACGNDVTDTSPAVHNDDTNTLTFTGIGIYQPSLFAALPTNQPAPLAPILRNAMHKNQVIGQRFDGQWLDIGTPQRLEALNQQIVGTDITGQIGSTDLQRPKYANEYANAVGNTTPHKLN